MSVTMLDTSSWTPAERQAAARDAYRASGYRLSGAELGRRFGRSGRWGRAQIQAIATEDRAAAAGSHDRAAGSPVAATDGRPAPEAVPMAAGGKGIDAGAPAVAAGGRTNTADPRQLAPTGGTHTVRDDASSADPDGSASGA